MYASTLKHLRCPRGCSKPLKLRVARSVQLGAVAQEDVTFGSLLCEGCRSDYPILSGVAILVEDVGDYLFAHIKGIAREVDETDFPKAFRKEMVRARREHAAGQGIEHIEDDLESQRVTALYVLTQYFDSRRMRDLAMSEEMRELITKHWDKGPFARIREGMSRRLGKEKDGYGLVELGCGVGGLLPALSTGQRLASYLGVDSSFASIVLARKLALGTKSSRETRFSVQAPEDLLFGSASREIGKEITARKSPAGTDADFVVGDAIRPPLQEAHWDVSIALNLIDMLDRPEFLPQVQRKLIRRGGWALQSSPYIWHPSAAKAMRKRLPKARDSADAVARLYESEGFAVERDESSQVPWLFFKNSRQLELYSVDLFFAWLK